MSTEKEVSYRTTNSYSTLKEICTTTKNVWMVFHGMGYLSKYFIRYFAHLNPEENYVIALQAPSKYYQDKQFKHVGASWLTRENTRVETENILRYIDAVYKKENIDQIPNLIVMGYSQGVSVACKWVASRKIECRTLLLHSGGIPRELESADFDFLPSQTQVIYVYGNKDPYITEARKTEEQLKGNQLFKDRLQIKVFEGVHEVNKEFLLRISREM